MSTNSTVWTAYKVKMKEGNHSLANRRVSKRLERKHRREEEVNKRRNFSNDMEEGFIPEHESEQDVNQSQSKPKAVKQTKCNDRLERLRKWQEEKKKKVQQERKTSKNKPVFKTGGIQRESEAVLFQSDLLQTSAGPKLSKPFPFAPKSVTSVVKETFGANKNRRPEGQRLLQGDNASIKMAPLKGKALERDATAKGLKKSKSVAVLAQQNPTKPALTKGPKAPQKEKPLRKFKSTASVVEPNKVNKPTRQQTDLSKKLTIAAASKRNMHETSPKTLRRNKSTVAKEMCNKGPTKPLKKQPQKPNNVLQTSHQQTGNKATEASSDQCSSDSLEDANVASPKHSTPHVLRLATKGKSASTGKGDASEGRRKSKRKSKRLLSPVPVTADSTTLKFFSDSESDVASVADKRLKTPRRQSRHGSSTEDISMADKKAKTPRRQSGHGSSTEDTSDGDKRQKTPRRQSRHGSSTEDTSDGDKRQKTPRRQSRHGSSTEDTSDGDKRQKTPRRQSRHGSSTEDTSDGDKRQKTPRRQSRHGSSTEDTSDGDKRQKTPRRQSRHGSSTEDTSDGDKRQKTPRRQSRHGSSTEDTSDGDKRQKTPRRQSRHGGSTEENTSPMSPFHASSKGKSMSSLSEENSKVLVNEDRHINDGCLIGNKQDEADNESFCQKSEVNAIRRSARKSLRISIMKGKNVQLASNSNALSVSSEEDADLSSSVSRLTLRQQTPYNKGHIRSSGRKVRSARKSTSRTPRMKESQTDSEEFLSPTRESGTVKNDFGSQTSTGKRSASYQARKMSNKKTTPENFSSERINSSMGASPTTSLTPGHRRSMRMLTYNDPEMVESNNDSGISPRKKPCLTPLGMTKLASLKRESGIVSQEPSPMAVDQDITPVSDQRVKMQSALAKKKSASPFVANSANNSIGRVACRSAGKSNLCDRRSTARGRRSLRSMAANLQIDEQAVAGMAGKGDSERSHSTPRQARRKSTVVSVSDEGTAVGRDLELVAPYHVERQQPVSSKASRILKELVVEKVEGETSFFEIPLDESFQSPKKSLSVTGSPAVSVVLDENKDEGKPTTPRTSEASPVTTPRSCRRARSIAPTSAFKEPGLPMSALRAQTASSRRRKTELGTPIRSPEEMVEILKKSPMVEMTRRRPRHSSTPVQSSENCSDLCVDKASINEGNKSAPLLSNNQSCSSDESLPSETRNNAAKPQEQYFRGLITIESHRLNALCSKWTQLAADTPDLSDDVLGQIRSVVGKAQLLMDQRFVQFSGLVDNYAFGLGEKETTPSDLQGFWEMIYFQVEDVDNLFKGLDNLQASGWQMKHPTPKAVIPKKKPMPKGVLKSKKVKSNFASFRNDMLKRKAATASANSDIGVEIIM